MFVVNTSKKIHFLFLRVSAIFRIKMPVYRLLLLNQKDTIVFNCVKVYTLFSSNNSGRFVATF